MKNDNKHNEYKEDLIAEIQQSILKNSLVISPKEIEKKIDEITVRNKNEKYDYKLIKHTFLRQKKNIIAEIFQKNIDKGEEALQIVIKYLKKNIEHYFILEKKRLENKEKCKLEENEEDSKLFDFCCKTIAEEILGYEKCIGNVPKYLALRIKGFHTGYFIQNYSQTQRKKPCYSYEVIKATIIITKNRIIKALKKKDFCDETAKINYVCAIIERNLNNTKLRFDKLEKAKEKTEIEMKKNLTSFEQEYDCVWDNSSSDNYVRKTKDKKNIEDFW